MTLKEIIIELEKLIPSYTSVDKIIVIHRVTGIKYNLKKSNWEKLYE